MQKECDPFLADSFEISKRLHWDIMNSQNRASVAQVIGYGTDTGTVNIKPMVNYYDKVEGFSEYPELINVPVVQLTSSSFSFKFPVNIGDVGVVLWMHREIQTALSGGGSTPVLGDLSNVNACVWMPFTTYSSPNFKQEGVDIVSSSVSLLEQVLNLLTGLYTFLQGCSGAGGDAAPVASAATAFEPVVTAVKSALTVFKGEQ